MRNLHPSLANAIQGRSPLFSLINGSTASEWALCLSLSSKQQYLSLRESFRFEAIPTGYSSGQICQAFSPITAKHRIIQCPLALSLISFPSSAFIRLSLSRKKPLTGRWADGDRQCFPGSKLIGRDWERIRNC